jgi:hypothetical protein
MRSADVAKIPPRNRYGFTTREMIRIARNLHPRAKERIARGHSKEFRSSMSIGSKAPFPFCG